MGPSDLNHLRPLPPDMVVDSSAMMAILLREPSAATIVEHLREAGGPLMSAGSVLETTIVAGGRSGPNGVMEIYNALDQMRIVVMPVDRQIAEGAHRAWQRFGKGNHPAKLNFGDCFTYALASHLELPVLCVGNDFAQTDLEVIRP